MPNKFNELLLKPDIIELYNEGITPNYGYLLNGRFEKDMVKTLYPLKTLNGNPITWEAREMEYLFPNVSLQPKRAGSGDPSPENVRPISGYDELAVNLKGKNLLSDENFQSSEKNGITFTKMGNGVVHIEGTATGGVDSVAVNDTPQLPPGKYFSISRYLQIVVKKASTGRNEWYSAFNGVNIERGDVIQYYYFIIQNGTTINQDDYIFLATGESAFQVSDFEPYQPGTTPTITLPETIYGGTVDAVTGVGEKTWEFVKFDGTENWDITLSSASTTTFTAPATAEPLPPIGVPHVTQMCNVAAWHAYNWTGNYPWTISGSQYTGYIYISVPNDVASTVEEWKSYLAAQASAGTPVQVAYKLATPEPFQATGNQQLTSLLGYNTIYTDGDSIALSIKARRLEV